MTTTPPARLSSEGLWLTAALAGVSRLPYDLKVRPIGNVDETLPGHPGLHVLQDSGFCVGRDLHEDLKKRMEILGLPDLQVTVRIDHPKFRSDHLAGPPPAFDPGVDPEKHPIEAYEALMRWNAEQRGTQRVAVLCRRGGEWVTAVRLWQIGKDTTASGASDAEFGGDDSDIPIQMHAEVQTEIDEIVVSFLGAADIAESVNQVIGDHEPAQFDGINVPAGLLEPILGRWQQNPAMDLIAALRDAGLNMPQARVIEAAADASATQITVTATEFSLGGEEYAPRVVTVIDSLIGRLMQSQSVSPDGLVWSTLMPATSQRIGQAVRHMCTELPSGEEWESHRRSRAFGS